MARIIMVSGKGGVGKTTVSAATGLACARSGLRTLVLSLDTAHSLRDSLNLDEQLFSDHEGEPVNVVENFDVQEIDLQEELQRDWKGFYQYGASLMINGGLNDVLAEEVAMMPGLDDIVALIRVNRHLKRGTYDVIILDAPPTGEALRFVSITSTVEWYVRKRLHMDRRVTKLIRPMSKMASMNLFLPDDGYFDAMKGLFEALEGIEDILRNPDITTVRLVTNADKMVVRETQRAYMYFSMYGMTTDSIIVNRLLPDEEDSYFGAWAKSQQKYADYIDSYFQPVPVSRIRYLQREVCGLERLDEFSALLFPNGSPARVMVDGPSYGFNKLSDDHYTLQLRMPFVQKEKLDINRTRSDLVVRLGNFKRNILLPRAIAALDTGRASVDNNVLTIHFSK